MRRPTVIITAASLVEKRQTPQNWGLLVTLAAPLPYVVFKTRGGLLFADMRTRWGEANSYASRVLDTRDSSNRLATLGIRVDLSRQIITRTEGIRNNDFRALNPERIDPIYVLKAVRAFPDRSSAMNRITVYAGRVSYGNIFAIPLNGERLEGVN